jgi:hypothetical protein
VAIELKTRRQSIRESQPQPARRASAQALYPSAEALRLATGVDYSKRIPKGRLGLPPSGQEGAVFSLHDAEKVEIGGRLFAERVFERTYGLDLWKNGARSPELGEAELVARAIQSRVFPRLRTTSIHVFEDGGRTIALEEFIPGAIEGAAAEQAFKKVDPKVKADELLLRMLLGDNDMLKWNNFLNVPGRGVFSRDFELQGTTALSVEDVAGNVKNARGDHSELTDDLLRQRAKPLSKFRSTHPDALAESFQALGLPPARAQATARRVIGTAQSIHTYLFGGAP